MATTSRRYQPSNSYYTTAAPIPTPQKAPSYSYAPISRVSASPPEHLSSTNSSTSGSRTSGGTYSTPSASGYISSHPSAAGYGNAYGGYDYDGSSSSGNGVDVVDMLSDRMNTAFDMGPIGMDEGLATQAKTSGQLNAKHRELLELQALAQRRLKSSRANFQDGMKAAKEVKGDLEWTQRKVSSLKTKAERRDSEMLRRAERKYPRDDRY